MNADTLFSLSGAVAMAGWLCLLASPFIPRLADRMAGLVVPALLAVAYAGLVLAFWSSAKGGFDSLDNVAALFQTRELLLAGWIHYLAFDLFVGAWIARTARQTGVPFWLVVPCLALTFLFGPAGFLAFLAIRAALNPAAAAVDCLTSRPWRSFMSASTFPNSRASFRLTSLVEALRTFEPRFFALGVLMLTAMIPTAFASLVDSREFLGIDVWVKPFKFEVALVVYTWTLAFFARFLPAGTIASRWYRAYVGAVAATIILEMIWIGGAAALGTASHFNPTPSGDLLYSAMGFAAVFLTSASAVYAVLIARNQSTGLSPALKDSVVIGLALVLPLTLAMAGTMAAMGSHFVGGAGSDAGGLPGMGWARDGGDLRVAHFFATHAMHFIPAFGLVSVAFFQPANRAPVWLFAAAFVGFVIVLFAQALRGEPFLPWLG